MKTVFRGRWLWMALAALWCGCSSQDFPRPMVSAPDFGAPDRSDDERLSAEAQARAERLAAMLEAWRKERGEVDTDYNVGPDDVLEIGVHALERPDQTTVIKPVVGRDGKVSLPLIGEFPAAGLSVRDLETRLSAAYKEKYLKNPNVTVKVAEYRSIPVVLAGAFSKPGIYYLTHKNSTVLELIAQAGGLSSAAGETLIIARGKNAGSQASNTVAETIEVDLNRLLMEGDIRQNAVVAAGDIITVPPAKKKFVYVMGYVRSPGAIELKEASQVDALQAVAMAGGLAPTARAQNSFVITERDGRRKAMSVNLIKVAHGRHPPLYLRPGDTLVIGSSLWARLGEFVRPTIGASASVAPVP